MLFPPEFSLTLRNPAGRAAYQRAASVSSALRLLPLSQDPGLLRFGAARNDRL